MSDGPRVELLWWEGCPSTPAARGLLEEALGIRGALPPLARVRAAAPLESLR